MTPRFEHNRKLAEKFSLGASYPLVTKQLELLPFNRRSLKPYAYNPSICHWGARILMAYRCHFGNTWKTRLGIAELDEKWQVISDKVVTLDGAHSEEDPHLFVHNDQLWLAWTESVELGKSTVKYGQLSEAAIWTAPTRHQPKFGKNNGSGMEKGWVPYSNQGAIHFIYSSMPDHIVIKVEGDNVSAPILMPPMKHWPWGQIKGGTGWLPYGDDFIRFFHSTLDNESVADAVNNSSRRYYLGWMTRSRIASRPLVCASEASNLTDTEKTRTNHFKSNVVFCSGAIAIGEKSYVLSVGINDSEIALLKVSKNDLHT